MTEHADPPPRSNRLPLGVALIIFGIVLLAAGDTIARVTGVIYFVCAAALLLRSQIDAIVSLIEAAARSVWSWCDRIAERYGQLILFAAGVALSGYALLLPALSGVYLSAGIALCAAVLVIRWMQRRVIVLPERAMTWIGGIVATTTVVYFAWTIWVEGINVPAHDEYAGVVLPLAAFNTATWGERIQSLFASHNDHRIFTTRFVAVALAEAFGALDFRAMMWISFAAFCAIAVVMFAAFRPKTDRRLLFLPVIPLLFQPLHHHLIYWGFSIQHMFGMVAVLLTFYAIERKTVPYFLLAIAAAICGTFSFANGQLAFFFGLAMLLIERRYREATMWLLPMSMCLWFYFEGFQKFGSETESVGFPGVILFFFVIIGAPISLGTLGDIEDALNIFVTLNQSASLVYLMVAVGVILVLLFAVISVSGYYRVNPTLFVFLIFLLVSIALVTQGRALRVFGLQDSFGYLAFGLQSRYTQYSVMILAVVYLAFAEITPSRLRAWVPAVFVATCAFNLLTWHYVRPAIRSHTANITLGLYLDTALQNTNWPSRSIDDQLKLEFLWRTPPDWIRLLDHNYDPPNDYVVRALGAVPVRAEIDGLTPAPSPAILTRVSDNDELVEVAVGPASSAALKDSTVYATFESGPTALMIPLLPLEALPASTSFLKMALPPNTTHLGYLPKSHLSPGKSSVGVLLHHNGSRIWSRSAYEVPCLQSRPPMFPPSNSTLLHWIAERNYCAQPVGGILHGLEMHPSISLNLGESFSIALLLNRARPQLEPDTLFSYSPAARATTPLQLIATGPDVRVQMRTGSSARTLQRSDLDFTQWNLIVVSVERGTLRVYRRNTNGQAINSAPIALDSEVILGKGTVRASGLDAPASNRIAELRIISAPMTLAEVDSLWQTAQLNLLVTNTP